MEMVLFIGIPASGKSSFFKERLFNTHVRVNRDMLKTQRREDLTKHLGLRLLVSAHGDFHARG